MPSTPFPGGFWVVCRSPVTGAGTRRHFATEGEARHYAAGLETVIASVRDDQPPELRTVVMVVAATDGATGRITRRPGPARLEDRSCAPAAPSAAIETYLIRRSSRFVGSRVYLAVLSLPPRWTTWRSRAYAVAGRAAADALVAELVASGVRGRVEAVPANRLAKGG